MFCRHQQRGGRAGGISWARDGAANVPGSSSSQTTRLSHARPATTTSQQQQQRQPPANQASQPPHPLALFFFSARSWPMTSLEVMEEPVPPEPPVMAPLVRMTAMAFLPLASPKALGLTLLYFLYPTCEWRAVQGAGVQGGGWVGEGEWVGGSWRRPPAAHPGP